ncbi:MAG: S41 family peptidase [Acidobacteria bacterium]|nr:S41 family peptidase [Acidobacteriota bacterium]
MRAHLRGLFLVTLILVVSAILGGSYGPTARATADDAGDLQSSVRSFTRVLSLVEKNYAEPVDADKLIYNGAIPGMLRTLDPHSTFFDTRAYTILREDQSGRYYGVGMTVAPKDSKTVVISPFVGSPAYKAGIRPGDVLFKVDGKSCDGLTSSEVADLLKGPKGTTVVITLLREGYDEPLVFTIVRDEIPRHGVDNALLVKPGIGYIRVSQFNETTEEELADAISKLGADSLNGMILDLRGNPGGLLNAGVAVAEAFLGPNQLIVSHRGRALPERRYTTDRSSRATNVPLVVLINAQSASASEIVAGALQDHDRALVVGDGSFGKGLVQTVFNLSESTGLALTTGKYYTPSGRLIQRDYKAVSLYEYYSNRGKPNARPTEVKLTDGGRQVYGGGGITPDVSISQPKYSAFQEIMLRKDVFFPFEQGVGGFARFYLGNKPTITKEFKVDEAVLNDLRRYLDKQNIRFVEADLVENRHWIEQKIKREVFLSIFGATEGYKIALEDDPQVQKAMEVLPQAQELYTKARRVLAQRQGAQLSTPR